MKLWMLTWKTTRNSTMTPRAYWLWLCGEKGPWYGLPEFYVVPWVIYTQWCARSHLARLTNGGLQACCTGNLCLLWLFQLEVGQTQIEPNILLSASCEDRHFRASHYSTTNQKAETCFEFVKEAITSRHSISLQFTKSRETLPVNTAISCLEFKNLMNKTPLIIYPS